MQHSAVLQGVTLTLLTYHTLLHRLSLYTRQCLQRVHRVTTRLFLELSYWRIDSRRHHTCWSTPPIPSLPCSLRSHQVLHCCRYRCLCTRAAWPMYFAVCATVNTLTRCTHPTTMFGLTSMRARYPRAPHACIYTTAPEEGSFVAVFHFCISYIINCLQYEVVDCLPTN